MMFDKYCIDKILDGEKTVTRRVVRNSRRPAIPGKIHKLKIDRTDKTFGLIKIISCKKEPNIYINDAEAKKEGFDSETDYIEYFCRINNVSHHVIPVWRVEFKLIDG